ncbi:MAG: NAD-dependent epimerase/dehydratase family protein [Patescibacteria group bacterium]
MTKNLVLITGGAGFIGSHTADALAKQGYAIRILDNLQPAVHKGRWPKYIIGKGYELIRGDVRKKSDWLKALRGVSYVYHFAAYQDQRPDFSSFFHTNTVGTALLYEVAAAKKFPIKKIVIASSQFVYGDGKYQCVNNKKTFYPELRTLQQFERKQFDILCLHGKPARFFAFEEDQPLMPTNSYGLSKEAIERLALRFGKTYGIPTTILRYSIVQGPRQSPHNLYSGALRIFVTQALMGKPITVFEDGKQKRDFVNIHDVVAANLLVLKNQKANFETFNVGGGMAYTVLDFAKQVFGVTNHESWLRSRESKVIGNKSILIGGFRRTDTRNAVSDISKLKKLGWKPKYDIEKSICDYVEWYKKERF